MLLKTFLDMAALSSKTTGQDICEHVNRVLDKLEMNHAELFGLTTDGTPSMTGRSNGYTENEWRPFDQF